MFYGTEYKKRGLKTILTFQYREYSKKQITNNEYVQNRNTSHTVLLLQKSHIVFTEVSLKCTYKTERFQNKMLDPDGISHKYEFGQ